MGAFFFQPKQLINMLAIKTAINPWELHSFMYIHTAIPHPMSCIINYSLSGDVPKGLSVDSAGIISGTIKHFGQQPSCSNNKPKKAPELDGKTWDSNGRFKPQTYDFNFKITAHWLEHISTPNGPVPCVKPGTTEASCTITLVKDHGIDNKIWLDDYTSEFELGDEADPGPLQAI